MAEPERIKLTIVEYKEPVPIGTKGAQKLQFKGRDSGGKELWYFTFRNSLFDVLSQKDREIEADVETSEREYNGQTYIDRKVSQVYVDGQQVGVQKRTTGSYGKSPEITRLELDAKARNTALMQACSKKDDPDEILKVADLFYIWLSVGLLKSQVVEKAEQDVKELWPEDSESKTDEQIEPQEDMTFNELLEYVKSHKKTEGWLFKTVGMTVDQAKENPYKCAMEIKEIAGW